MARSSRRFLPVVGLVAAAAGQAHNATGPNMNGHYTIANPGTAYQSVPPTTHACTDPDPRHKLQESTESTLQPPYAGSRTRTTFDPLV